MLYMPAEYHLVLSKVSRLDYTLSSVPRKHYPELWLSLGGMGLYECSRGSSASPASPSPSPARTPLSAPLPFRTDRALEDSRLAGREAEAQEERDPVQSLGEVRGSERVPLSVPCPFH